MIRLFQNFKYNNRYDYIKTFNSKEDQEKYFNSLTYSTIDDTNYIKEHIDSFKINRSYDYLVENGFNYLMFNNGYKDVYAFIIEKQYVSEEVTRIIFEVDVIQTYMFNFNINKSFIERKNCAINEITDFDEGLNIGEHTVTEECVVLRKEYSWFAMFNGIKEQQIIFDSNNNISNVINMPSPQLKPNCFIDSIPYPIHFMELKESYEEPKIIPIDPPGGGGQLPPIEGGDWRNGILSPSGFRFIKGYEGFAPNKYQDSGGYWTIAYGVTLHGEPDIYNDLVSKQPVSESEAAQISYRLKNENYGKKIYNNLINGGIQHQYQFDALLSLSYNCGVGTILGSGYDVKVWEAIKQDPTNEAYIRPIWESFKITSNGIPLEGLRLRRIQECNMFFNKYYEVRDIAIINSSGNITGTVTDNNGDGWLPKGD